MANGNATIIGSARLGSARQERSAVFSVCQVLFHRIYNEPVSCRRQGSLRLGFGFLRLPEGWWFDIEILTTIRKHIFSRYVGCRRKSQADN